MEWILAPLPWTAPRTVLRIRWVATTPGDRLIEYDVQRNTFQWKGNALDQVSRCESTTALADWLQSSLFFEVLSIFLDREINRADFVTPLSETSNSTTTTVIDLNREPAQEYFRAWRRTVSQLSPRQQHWVQERIGALLRFAWINADRFERGADELGDDETLDAVMVSIRLLVNLLHVVLEDTVETINPHSSRAWSPWFAASFDRIRNRFRLRNPFPETFDELSTLQFANRVDFRRRFYDPPSSFRPFISETGNHGRASELLLRMFVSNGWCPFRATQICSRHEYLVAATLASLKQNSSPQDDHSRCLELHECCAHDLNLDRPAEYPFRHIEEPHECAFVHVPRHEIVNIIRSGGIPLISVNLEDDLDLQVVRCTPYINYTAVSHVWSDGLGNPKSNSLPRCQLLRLRSMMFQAYFHQFSPFYDSNDDLGSYLYWSNYRKTRSRRPDSAIDTSRVYFWMDTLCIPVPLGAESTEEEKELKLQAIRHITPIFAGARNTLVLDKLLQAAGPLDTASVTGDEFSALIFGSKWMQRGWTLEEGILSSTCMFQIMGKPYEMSGSMHHQLPVPAINQSPLDRAYIKTRRTMVLTLKRHLMDEMKKLPHETFASKATQLRDILQLPQFVRAWNSLVDRKVTNPQDGPLILANLLEFNVVDLKHIPQADRLKALIQSCEEIPLSLFFNTGPRMRILGHPELDWIPKSIAGDPLVGGAVLQRLKSDGDMVKLFISQSDCDPGSFVVLKTLDDLQIPYDTSGFVLEILGGNTPGSKEKYVIEMSRPETGSPAPQDEEHRRLAHQNYGLSQGTCIIIDFTSGSRTAQGLSGTGVRCYVDSTRGKKVNLHYDSPLKALRLDPATRESFDVYASLPCFTMRHLDRSFLLRFNYEASLWSKRLLRKPFHHQHPLIYRWITMFLTLVIVMAFIIAVGTLIITVRYKMGWRQGPSAHAHLITTLVGPVVGAFVYKMIHGAFAMRAYAAWFRSYDEEHMSPERDGLLRRMRNAIRWRFARWRYGVPPGVTEVSIRLSSLRAGHQPTDDFPGEIILE